MEQVRLDQARAVLEEAKALLADEMDIGFVLTNLFYAFYYPMLAVMNEGQVPTTMQSITIALFDQQFIKAGIFRQEYADAVHRVFTLKPKCSGEKTPVSADEVNKLLALARDFIADAEEHCT
ncbi:MAG: hypothetical protein HGB21_00715 [Nitrospirae bacterium]|nr:hypothetical protein [Nitrospirota bacterium]